MAEPEVSQDELKTMGDVDQALRTMHENRTAYDLAHRQADEAAAVILRHLASVVKPLDEEYVQIKASLTTYLLRHRKSILRHLGKTIRLTNGLVTWVIKARSVDTGKDVSDAIRFLESHPDGERYLTRTTTLNKDALATCDDDNLLRSLRRRDVRVSKHEYLSVKPTGASKTVQLSRRLYPRRR